MGQPTKRRNRKKIAAIVAGAAVAIVLITALARSASTPLAEPLSPPEPGWLRLRIADVGSIDYPPDFLELQSGDYREVVDRLVPGYETPSSDFILQQAGLNQLEPSAFEEFRRVILETSYLNPGEEVFPANMKYSMTNQELTEIQNAWVSQLAQAYAQQNREGLGDNKIIDPGMVEIVEINGMFPILWTYKRQLDGNPAVLVEQYTFPNYNKIHLLIFSCRIVEEEDCSDIYERMLDSFRLEGP